MGQGDPVQLEAERSGLTRRTRVHGLLGMSRHACPGPAGDQGRGREALG